MSRTLVFLSYGEGQHVYETIFSILSAQRWLLRQSGSVGLVVMTDTPQHFAGLGVKLETLANSTLQRWLGHSTYVHRRKLEAMKCALSRYGGAVALVDGDTWFLRSPSALFKHIGPGRCCLHLRESKLIDSGTGPNKSLAEFLRHSDFYRRDGSAFRIDPNSTMWNSGVIGLHEADVDRIDDALHLLDQLIPCASSVHTIEQFAISQALADMDLRETADIVFHYWPQRVRARFRDIVRIVVNDSEGAPLSERAAAIYAMRPKATLQRSLILKLKRLMQMVGLPVKGVRASG